MNKTGKSGVCRKHEKHGILFCPTHPRGPHPASLWDDCGNAGKLAQRCACKQIPIALHTVQRKKKPHITCGCNGRQAEHFSTSPPCLQPKAPADGGHHNAAVRAQGLECGGEQKHAYETRTSTCRNSCLRSMGRGVENGGAWPKGLQSRSRDISRCLRRTSPPDRSVLGRQHIPKQEKLGVTFQFSRHMAARARASWGGAEAADARHEVARPEAAQRAPGEWRRKPSAKVEQTVRKAGLTASALRLRIDKGAQPSVRPGKAPGPGAAGSNSKNIGKFQASG